MIAGADSLRNLPVAEVRPDPGQPRRTFDEGALGDLAASIAAIGLVEPIVVRREPGGSGYVLVAGERRWRAHLILGAETIAASIVEVEGADLRIAQLAENLQREDLPPCEEARAMRAVLDETTWTHIELARRLGVRPHRLSGRMALLNLRPEYQDLVDRGQLPEIAAVQMGRLPPHRQDELFRLIRSGRATGATVRTFANAAIEAEAQPPLLDAPAPLAADRARVSRIERRIDAALAILAEGFDDNEIVAARRIDPMRAGTYADRLVLIGRALAQLERALRRNAAQLAFATLEESRI
jgi:ParB family chromosome partitioning protein